MGLSLMGTTSYVSGWRERSTSIESIDQAYTMQPHHGVIVRGQLHIRKELFSDFKSIVTQGTVSFPTNSSVVISSQREPMLMQQGPALLHPP